ncbi:hypothetical protein T484DRAFT_1818769 [Baffinella frigidus]|nr:hypothetical protein T484DRAFT_1818769 [Cryptophyta sp. CCMP2293]
MAAISLLFVAVVSNGPGFVSGYTCPGSYDCPGNPQRLRDEAAAKRPPPPQICYVGWDSTEYDAMLSRFLLKPRAPGNSTGLCLRSCDTTSPIGDYNLTQTCVRLSATPIGPHIMGCIPNVAVKSDVAVNCSANNGAGGKVTVRGREWDFTCCDSPGCNVPSLSEPLEEHAGTCASNGAVTTALSSAWAFANQAGATPFVDPALPPPASPYQCGASDTLVNQTAVYNYSTAVDGTAGAPPGMIVGQPVDGTPGMPPPQVDRTPAMPPDGTPAMPPREIARLPVDGTPAAAAGEIVRLPVAERCAKAFGEAAAGGGSTCLTLQAQFEQKAERPGGRAGAWLPDSKRYE